MASMQGQIGNLSEASLTDVQWDDIVREHGLSTVDSAMMTNPMTGDSVHIGAPDLIAELGVNGDRVGVFRLLRFRDTIEFEGQGEIFESVVERMCKQVGGELVKF